VLFRLARRNGTVVTRWLTSVDLKFKHVIAVLCVIIMS
jgi:hypothetical protein